MHITRRHLGELKDTLNEDFKNQICWKNSNRTEKGLLLTQFGGIQ
jgi:hypothetical protein